MWQKNYAYEYIPQAIEALPELRRELERHPASKDALLQIFVAGYGWQEATELLDSLDREMPGLKRQAAPSTFPVIWSIRAGSS